MDERILISKLRAKVKGRVIAREDAGYDQARAVFYGWVDRRPLVIVRVTDEADVFRVVSLAREAGLELAIRSGGHSLAGHGVSEGGIVIDLSDMRACRSMLRSALPGPKRDLPRANTRLQRMPTASRPGSATPARSGSEGSRWEAESGSSSASMASPLITFLPRMS